MEQLSCLFNCHLPVYYATSSDSNPTSTPTHLAVIRFRSARKVVSNDDLGPYLLLACRFETSVRS